MTFLTIEQLANLLGVCKRTIFRLEAKGSIPKGIRLSKGTIRWAESTISDWIKSLDTTVIEAKKQAKEKVNQKKALAKIETTAFRISETIEIPIKNELIRSWADTYPKEFLTEEMKKARNWVLANTHKAPKSNWGRFFNSWFSRAWDQYRKTLASNKPVGITDDDVKRIMKEIEDEDARRRSLYRTKN